MNIIVIWDTKMKKCLVLCVVLVLGISLTACESVELEYYADTTVPTFTCVTGIEVSERNYTAGVYIYSYYCDDSEEYVSEYIDYLKTQGFVVEQADDTDENMTTLINDHYRVLIGRRGSTEVHVIPAKYF